MRKTIDANFTSMGSKTDEVVLVRNDTEGAPVRRLDPSAYTRKSSQHALSALCHLMAPVK